LLYINAGLLAIIIIIIVAFLVLVVIWIVRAHQRKVAAGREELIGRMAVVVTTLAPKGVVFLEGEHWTAVVDKGRVEPEEEVIITGIDGLKLMVTRKQ
jgi:membrane-bound ClpP family serine protease